MVEGVQLATVFEGATFATVLVAGLLALRYWIQGSPERARVRNEGVGQQAKIDEDLRGEAAERFKEFRVEVHGLRNELQEVRAVLLITTAKSVRRGEKLDMVLFILRLVMDELRAKEPGNKVLAQAATLLERVEDEPHEKGNSKTLNEAENTVEAAQTTVREIKAEEAKK